jgi:hypothetical protein
MSVDGIWYVKLADGDVERVTLDELDEAFQSGRVDENSMVLADGADTWMKLSDLLGSPEQALEPGPPAAAPTPHAQVPTTVPAVVQPVQVVAQPFVGQPVATDPLRAPAPIVAAARPVMGGSPVAPVTRVAPAHAVPGIMTMRPPVGMPVTPVVSSMRPVTFDLGAGSLDMDDPFRAPTSRKRWVVGALGTLLVLGAGGFIAVTQAASSTSSSPPPVFAAANAAQPPASPEPQAYAPTPPSSPQTNLAGPSSIMDPTQQHLTDEQKQKLLEADRKLKSHATNGGGSTWHAPKEKSTGFTSGGNKYDPLNSSL